MAVLLDAAEGRGCSHCETGYAIEEVRSPAGTVHLCLECVMRWFPGKDVAWWEARHAPLLDHVEMALRRSLARDLAQAAASSERRMHGEVRERP